MDVPTDVLIADLVVTTVEERDCELNRALGAAHYKASIDRKLGILVTRHDFCRFTVALTATVPFGVIHERDHVRGTS